MTFRKATTGLALTASALLAGCGPGGSVSEMFPRLGLYFNQDEQGANLAYGAANSDDVGVMLQCAKGSGEVQLTDVAQARPADRLILVSGPQRLELPVTFSPDETGASLARASLPADAPVMQGFRHSGAIAVSLGASRYGLKARREEQSAVSNFFAACQRS